MHSRHAHFSYVIEIHTLPSGFPSIHSNAWGYSIRFHRTDQLPKMKNEGGIEVSSSWHEIIITPETSWCFFFLFFPFFSCAILCFCQHEMAKLWRVPCMMWTSQWVDAYFIRSDYINACLPKYVLSLLFECKKSTWQTAAHNSLSLFVHPHVCACGWVRPLLVSVWFCCASTWDDLSGFPNINGRKESTNFQRWHASEEQRVSVGAFANIITLKQ